MVWCKLHVYRKRECRRHAERIARDGGVGRASFAPNAGIPGKVREMVASRRDAANSRGTSVRGICEASRFVGN